MSSYYLLLLMLRVEAEVPIRSKAATAASPCAFTVQQRAKLYPQLQVSGCDTNFFESCSNNCFACGRNGQSLDCKVYCAAQQGGDCATKYLEFCAAEPEEFKKPGEVNPCDGASKATLIALLTARLIMHVL